MDLDKETEERIEAPVSRRPCVRPALKLPQAVDKMRVNLPRPRQPEAAEAARTRQRRQAGEGLVARRQRERGRADGDQRPLLGAHSDRRQHRAEALAPADEARCRASAVRDFGLEQDDAEVIKLPCRRSSTASGCRCTGHGHEDFSPFLSEPKMRELLEGIYEEPELTVVVSEVLQAITSHRADGQPLALEAASCGSRTRSTWPRVTRGSRSRRAESRCTRSPPPRSTTS